MKSTSSGSGLRSVLAIASTPRSATSRRRISASISFLNCSMRSSYSSLLEALLERRQLAARPARGPASISLLEHAVEVEVPQRAVQVVRAADRPAGLHAGEAAARPGGPAPASSPRRRSAAPGCSICGELLGRQLSIAAAAAALRWRCCSCICLLSAPRAARRARRRRRRRCGTAARAARSRPRTPSRTPASGVLFFTSVAPSAYLNASRSSSGMCLTASMASRFSVRLTGSPACAQLVDEARRAASSDRRRRRRLGGDGRSRRRLPAAASGWPCVLVELLDRLGDVGLVLEQDVERLLGRLGVDRARCRAAAACGPSRASRTPTAPSSARAGGSSARCGRPGRPGSR